MDIPFPTAAPPKEEALDGRALEYYKQITGVQDYSAERYDQTTMFPGARPSWAEDILRRTEPTASDQLEGNDVKIPHTYQHSSSPTKQK